MVQSMYQSRYGHPEPLNRNLQSKALQGRQGRQGREKSITLNLPNVDERSRFASGRTRCTAGVTERPTPIRTAQDYGRYPCSEYEMPSTIRRSMTRASTPAASINAINHIHSSIEAIRITPEQHERVGRTTRKASASRHGPLFLQLP